MTSLPDRAEKLKENLSLARFAFPCNCILTLQTLRRHSVLWFLYNESDCSTLYVDIDISTGSID